MDPYEDPYKNHHFPGMLQAKIHTFSHSQYFLPYFTCFNNQFSILSPMKMVINWVYLQVPTAARLTCSYQDLTFAGACPELGEYVVRAGAGAGAETMGMGSWDLHI
jgi:hypothetical protein